MAPITIATLLYDGVNALDVAGPLEAFAAACTGNNTPGYTIDTWSLGALDVRTESGLLLRAHRRAPERPAADLLLVPGGSGVRDPRTLKALGDWLRRHHAAFVRIASVCTGAYAVAESGLADGRTLTTHWAHANDLARRYPAVRVQSDALCTQDGPLYSSGGVTAGIDLALSIIEKDLGVRTAAATARELVVFLRRTGTQAQFSEPLRLQAMNDDGLQEVCLWATNHPDADLSVEALATRANMSPRQFARRFRSAMGITPGRFVVTLRLDRARTALAGGRVSIKRVASGAGFQSVDGFRRAFERELGVSPSEYQQRFANRRPR
ncbi:MAG TPA: GlxA family transcriptional regulator [Gemmatimonas aurantiaca]|uniref:AraC family transcriptional regulator n=2 Tax=Gemmatimonas aurantiaca TaxID=173480 RepID=C1ABV7_GEMAT|nr:GlxA family transcriptional regulator [Gemmatimonas aurantiaca]BAH39984.1 AraC family transcriptional regulator [Gemmatimonas aurantiaca T-27]HCT58008.1 GlxA family transcriptional regulator [Gemmatimonas aurantiaca]